MNLAKTEPHPRKSALRSSVGSRIHPSATPRSPQTPSLPDARPRSDLPLCGGREIKFLAVRLKTLLIFIGIAFGSFAHANLVLNGSFEVNTNPGPYGGEADVADGWFVFNDLIPGTPDVWNNLGVDGLLPGSYGYFNNFTAYEGSNFVSIASGGLSEGVESSLMTLIGGLTYRVSAAMAYDAANAGNLNVPAPLAIRLRQGANPSTVLTVMAANTVANTWQTRSYDFSVSTTDSYSLILYGEFPGVTSYFVIDDVSIAAVPEPSTMLTLAVGLGAVGLMRRRRV